MQQFVELLCGVLNLKVSLLKILPFKVNLKIRNKIIMVKDFIKKNGSVSFTLI